LGLLPSRQLHPVGAPVLAASARARRSARTGWLRQYESIASRGIGGMNRRASACLSTVAGNTLGNALLRRASARRFCSSRHSDMMSSPFGSRHHGG
jgi:hypothetical protein